MLPWHSGLRGPVRMRTLAGAPSQGVRPAWGWDAAGNDDRPRRLVRAVAEGAALFRPTAVSPPYSAPGASRAVRHSFRRLVLYQAPER